MKGLRGSGEFVSIAGVVWRVELWVEGYTGASCAMSFAGSEPLVITWEETGRLEPMEGSTAVLRLISESDREWLDLYSIERTRVRLDVYRGGVKYWQGTLDSEFYEEPYETLQGYEVSLSFSDLGVLEDIDYDLTGTVLVSEVMVHGLELAGLTLGMDFGRVSTLFEDGAECTPDRLSVRSDNYYDEEGKATKYKEVIRDLLQPLALKIRQRGGRFLVYDLNGVYTTRAEGGVIKWDGSTQTLAMADVAQRIEVSFSPYGESELITDELEYTGKTSADVRNVGINNPNDPVYGEYYTFFNDYTTKIKSSSANSAAEYEDFNIFLSATGGTGLAEIHTEAAYAKFVPIFGNADERTCVAWRLMVGQGDMSKDLTNTTVRHIWRSPVTESRGSSKVILRTKRVYVAGYTPEEGDVSRYLRLKLPLLMDARYNPFDSKSDNLGNERDHDYYVKTRTGYVFIPVGVTIYDAPEGGNAICHYDNSAAATTATARYAGGGYWADGVATIGDMWVEYYSTSDQKEDCGIRGWKNNRTLVGRPEKYSGRPSGGGRSRYPGLTEREKKIDDGEYMSYPEKGGWLEVTVYEGYRAFDYGEKAGFNENSEYWDYTYVNGSYVGNPYRLFIRWLMYGAPTVELVCGNGNIDKESIDDVEYTGWIERAAKETLDISTTYGTVSPPTPGARGGIIRASDGSLVSKLMRAGVTDVPERLLIGTAISQYGERRLKLSGEAVIMPGATLTCSERLQGDRVFWIASERQDVLADVSETTIIELGDEVYAAIES